MTPASRLPHEWRTHYRGTGQGLGQDAHTCAHCGEVRMGWPAPDPSVGSECWVRLRAALNAVTPLVD